MYGQLAHTGHSSHSTTTNTINNIINIINITIIINSSSSSSSTRVPQQQPLRQQQVWAVLHTLLLNCNCSIRNSAADKRFVCLATQLRHCDSCTQRCGMSLVFSESMFINACLKQLDLTQHVSHAI
jgi:hypothetical protein